MDDRSQCLPMDKTGILILAAGSSSRLGRPKQLLPFKSRSLLSHVVTESLAASLQPVVVVTGAYRAEVEDALRGESVALAFNAGWETGMASGIVAGLKEALVIEPLLKGVIVAVCDQPYVSAGLFRSLMLTYREKGKGLVACSYSGTMGTPVLFERKYFGELAALSGEAGAKKVLNRYPDDIAIVPFPEGGIDIDTEKDYDTLEKA